VRIGWPDAASRVAKVCRRSWNRIGRTPAATHFFFKLKAPYNAIGGFGLFARFAPLPVWRAWDVFGQANGTADEHELLKRLGRLNGLPLRRDIHRLFDLGFVTVRPDLRFAVSPALGDAYANGKTYYALDGRRIAKPAMPDAQPSRELLAWHGDVVFRP
jgi:hypothetical protein